MVNKKAENLREKTGSGLHFFSQKKAAAHFEPPFSAFHIAWATVQSAAKRQSG